MVIAHLAALGRRRLAFASAQPTGSAAEARLAGYLDAVQEVDRGGSRRVELGDFSADFGRAAARRLVAGADRPDAIVCGADVVALGVLSTLHEMGVAIPDDIAVAGFDDIPYAAIASPGLTTVRQPTDEMGKECVRLLEQRIADPGRAHSSSVFSPSLVVRGSTVKGS
jgi:LacI family transcriptional regulator